MKNCKQSKNQSVYEHGISVNRYLHDLLDHLRYNTDLKFEWKMPTWVYDYKDLILSNLPSNETLDLYTIYHDIGKPFCIETDNDGKNHFPNHSKISSEIFSQIFDDKIAEYLIKHDMDIHLLKSNDVNEFSKNPFCLTLLLSGLSELHSNAEMFGGSESVGFKIKWKCLNKRGCQILALINKK